MQVVKQHVTQAIIFLHSLHSSPEIFNKPNREIHAYTYHFPYDIPPSSILKYTGVYYTCVPGFIYPKSTNRLGYFQRLLPQIVRSLALLCALSLYICLNSSSYLPSNYYVLNILVFVSIQFSFINTSWDISVSILQRETEAKS